jgi:hypothetical protein
MSQVLVWKSDADGKLFEDKAKYTKHLRKLGADRAQVRRLEKRAADREVFLDTMGQVGSFDELQQFIVNNWSFFRDNMIQHNNWRKRNQYAKKDDQLISLTLSSLTFIKELSNSHSSPRKGISNFDSRHERNRGKPTGYAGWRGRISYSVTSSSGFGSDYFKDTPICTGSGGGGDERLSYDLSLWAADFPVMWEKHCRDTWVMLENQERQHVWRAVGGKGLAIPATEADIPSDWVLPDPLEATSFYAGQTYGSATE